MTTVKEIATESRPIAIASPIAVVAPETVTRETVAPKTAAVVVDISAIPETPAELLQQWAPAKKPLIHTVIAAALVRFWDGLTGPGMTQREREQREMFEHSGYANSVRRYL